MIICYEEHNEMTIHLPNDVEREILAQVQSGQFASVDAAITEAWRDFQRHRLARQASAHPTSPDPLLGSASDHAELVDQIVEDAMRNREQRPWRLTNGE
jgi:Arc/MetJ-type ribon-helix-helix transcriptional regulator